MATDQTQKTPHNVLQLHGGGALVLSELIKCAILETITGKRTPDLFQSIIADSGGAIIALCLHKLPAKDVLELFMKAIPDALPGASFFLAQPLPKTANRFDNSKLESVIKSVLGTTTLSDISGNIFIRTHSIEDRAQRIAKISPTNAQPVYNNAAPATRLLDIAMAASAIPGVMPEHEDANIDPIADQNPTAILYKLKTTFPDMDIHFVQMGNIYSTEIVKTLRSTSFLRSIVTGVFQNYVAYHNHSAHIEDVKELLPDNRISSLLTFAAGRYSSTNNSIHQRTRLAVATLNDIETHTDEYAALANALSGNAPCTMSVHDAISVLKNQLDPHMVKEKIVTDTPEDLPEQFPSRRVIPVSDTLLYKAGYLAGFLTGKFKSYTGEYLDTAGHQLSESLDHAKTSLTRKLLPNTDTTDDIRKPQP